MGRRKIEMKMVKDSSSRQVTFSKRRTGLYKKANELATLCAAQVAIVVFSPGGKPFAFGHPSVDLVAERFLKRECRRTKQVVGPVTTPEAEQLSHELNELVKQLHTEKKRGEMLKKAVKASRVAASTRRRKAVKPIEELGMKELQELRNSLEELRDNLRGRITEIEASTSLLLLSRNVVSERKFTKLGSQFL